MTLALVPNMYKQSMIPRRFQGSILKYPLTIRTSGTFVRFRFVSFEKNDSDCWLFLNYKEEVDVNINYQYWHFHHR